MVPTLGSLAKEIETVTIWCTYAWCGHKSTMRLQELIDWQGPDDWLGADMPFPQIKRYFRCEECGRKDAGCQPDWPNQIQENRTKHGLDWNPEKGIGDNGSDVDGE